MRAPALTKQAAAEAMSLQRGQSTRWQRGQGPNVHRPFQGKAMGTLTVRDIEHTELLTKAAGTSAQRLCKNWDKALNKGNGGNPPFVTLGWLAAGRDI